jgi:hypothetical protein
MKARLSSEFQQNKQKVLKERDSQWKSKVRNLIPLRSLFVFIRKLFRADFASSSGFRTFSWIGNQERRPCLYRRIRIGPENYCKKRVDRMRST